MSVLPLTPLLGPRSSPVPLRNEMKEMRGKRERQTDRARERQTERDRETETERAGTHREINRETYRGEQRGGRLA